MVFAVCHSIGATFGKPLAHCQVIPCIIKGLSISPDNVELWNRGDSLRRIFFPDRQGFAVPVRPWWGLTDVFAQVYFLQDWGWGWWGWCVQGKQLSARKTLNNIEQYWTCWNWHAENGQNANPNLSDEFLTKIWCILKNCLKVLAFMSLWSRNMWVTKQSLGCRMTWTARWNQPSKDLRTAAATAATLTGWWFCILFRIKIWSDCHYLHGLKPPRKKIHHGAVSRWFALHQIRSIVYNYMGMGRAWGTNGQKHNLSC